MSNVSTCHTCSFDRTSKKTTQASKAGTAPAGAATHVPPDESKCVHGDATMAARSPRACVRLLRAAGERECDHDGSRHAEERKNCLRSARQSRARLPRV